jgi:hypothetical protein
MNPFAGWENFYVIVGSSAGALIGLQFVVMTLIAGTPAGHGSAQAGHTFATPTVVHFGATLLLAGIITAPWVVVFPAAALWGSLGLVGAIYALYVAHRMRTQVAYRPQFEDWLFHAFLPLVAYGALVFSAVLSRDHLHRALLINAAAAMLLLFVGIHNAWDAVTYHVFVQGRKGQ